MTPEAIDRELYGRLQGLLEGWTGLSPAEANRDACAALTREQKRRLRDLGELLSLRFVLSHADDHLLHLVAEL